MTKVMGTRFLTATLALALLAGTVRAAEETSGPRPYVVLIGIDQPADKDVKARPHAEDDAKALYDLFANKDYLGAKNIRLLLGKEDDKRKSTPATRKNILDAVQWIAKEARPEDPILFGFFGSSAMIGKDQDRRCYLASDSTLKGKDKDSVTASEIADAFKDLKSKKFCGFVDVEFVGFAGNARSLIEQVLDKDPFKEFVGSDGPDKAPLPGRLVFVKTNGLTLSLNTEKHGIFAQALLDGLAGKADTEGYEPDGQVTVDELIEYLDKNMPELTKKYAKTQDEKGQIHFVLGSRGNHYPLVHNPAVWPKVQENLKKLAELTKDGKIDAKLSEEGQTLLARMPRLEAQRELRKDYQKLVAGTVTPEAFGTERNTILEGMKLRRADALTFAQKVLEATQLIKEMYVKDMNQGEMVVSAIKEIYRRTEEKMPADVESKLGDPKTLGMAEMLDLLVKARQELGKREDLGKHKDIDIALSGITRKLDRYSEYIDPERLAKFDQDIRGHFNGIGALIGKDLDKDVLKIVTPIKGSPAYKAGIMAGDLILNISTDVDGKPVEKSTKGMTVSDAVKIILGEINTPVKLTIEREGKDKPFDMVIRRGQVEVETVIGAKRKTDDSWEYMIDPESKIGYIRLTQFSDNSFRDMRLAMMDLLRRGVKGFVLDLRFNPGGLLGSAKDVTDLFIDDGVIVTVKERSRPEMVYRGTVAGSLTDFPMVCLINGYSASGSEIVAAALQDHKRALIIGERSYGKGSVQSIERFDGGKMKLTTATYYRPSGKNINKAATTGKDDEEWGVTPDKVVPFSPHQQDDLAEYHHEIEMIQRPDKRVDPKKFDDKQLNTALDYLRNQIKMAAKAPGNKAG